MVRNPVGEDMKVGDSGPIPINDEGRSDFVRKPEPVDAVPWPLPASRRYILSLPLPCFMVCGGSEGAGMDRDFRFGYCWLPSPPPPPSFCCRALNSPSRGAGNTSMGCRGTAMSRGGAFDTRVPSMVGTCNRAVNAAAAAAPAAVCSKAATTQEPNLLVVRGRSRVSTKRNTKK